jgi:hypothetical protein
MQESARRQLLSGERVLWEGTPSTGLILRPTEAFLIPFSLLPLHDRVLVRRVEAEEKTAGGIIIPDTAKEKPQEGEVVAVGTGAKRRGRQGHPARRQGRRQDPVRQMVGHRGQDRR